MIEKPGDNLHVPVSPGGSPALGLVVVTLPDGKHLEFAAPITGGEIASAIGPGLAKAAIAIQSMGSRATLQHSSAATRPSQ